MVDATDLKSVGLIAREGSSPSPGTILCKAGTHSFGCFSYGGKGLSNRFKKGDELEKTIFAGVHGTPQLRPDEKRRFLGFFRERVIEAVTFDQIRTKEGLRIMTEALRDPRGIELVIHQDVRVAAMPLVLEAQKKGLDFTIVGDPQFSGEVAVLLAARDAVDVSRLASEK